MSYQWLYLFACGLYILLKTLKIRHQRHQQKNSICKPEILTLYSLVLFIESRLYLLYDFKDFSSDHVLSMVNSEESVPTTAVKCEMTVSSSRSLVKCSINVKILCDWLDCLFVENSLESTIYVIKLGVQIYFTLNQYLSLQSKSFSESPCPLSAL